MTSEGEAAILAAIGKLAGDLSDIRIRLVRVEQVLNVMALATLAPDECTALGIRAVRPIPPAAGSSVPSTAVPLAAKPWE
jgi:hypothetical protein